MLLTSADGASVELRPTRYQFPAEADLPRDWDANWLEIHGRITTDAGESWTFDDPCLTTWEAHELGAWLRDAAEGRVAETTLPIEYDADGLLSFTEPALGFSVATLGSTHLVLRVHLSLEALAGKPGIDEEMPYDFYGFSVGLRMAPDDLLVAAREWQGDLVPFPER